ncbi:MAG TPA: hypothetical protein VE090_03115 [Methylomirabilota bacterium]|nr:hypothetical protein [Methylomirabilota bacterium]
MKKIVLILAIFACISTLFAPQASAKTSAPSATLISPSDMPIKEQDKRAQILKSYLEGYNSPLAPFAKDMIEEADKNNLDWKLVPAIAGVESYFGQQIPPYSFNGWGFGIYGNNVRRFGSWKEGITVVSESLRQDYMNKWGAKDINEIGALYAASPTWAYKVQHFMDELDQAQTTTATNTLSISL